MGEYAHYHRFKARHHFTPRHAKPTRRARLTARLELLWVRAWAGADARTALGVA